MSRNKLSENKWIHINLEIVNNPDVRYFMNRQNRSADNYDHEEAKLKLESKGLINSDGFKGTLSDHGENVCRKGGWIPYLRSEWRKDKIEEGVKRKEIRKEKIWKYIRWAVGILVPIAVLLIVRNCDKDLELERQPQEDQYLRPKQERPIEEEVPLEDTTTIQKDSLMIKISKLEE